MTRDALVDRIVENARKVVGLDPIAGHDEHRVRVFANRHGTGTGYLPKYQAQLREDLLLLEHFDVVAMLDTPDDVCLLCGDPCGPESSTYCTTHFIG